MGGQANTNSTLGSSNFDGSKQTVVKANASAGFLLFLTQVMVVVVQQCRSWFRRCSKNNVS